MVDSFEAYANRISVVKNDHVVFDTDNKSVNLFPESQALRRTVAGGNPLVVDFPDFLKVNAHWRQGTGTSECRSFTSLIYQEWGPDYVDGDDWWYPTNPSYPGGDLASNYRNLPEQFVGTIPAGADYLDIRLNLTNTQVPSTILSVPIFTLLVSGQWTALQGYSCPVELQNPIARMFEFRVDGTNVYLRRYQSVRRYQQITSWLANNDDSSASGWTFGDTSYRPSFELASTAAQGGQPRSVLGLLAYEIEHKGPDTNGSKRRRVAGSNACSVVDPTNYRSVWQGDLIIRPGRRT